MTLDEKLLKLNLSRSGYYDRLRTGWSKEDALSIPCLKKRRKTKELPDSDVFESEFQKKRGKK